jgi:hypothetical protein
MKKLTLRLLVLILSVYLAGSIYPLLAHEAGHSHAPAPAPAPAPPPAPAPVPSAPPMLDTRAGPPPMLPPTSTPSSMGGCGGATQPTPPQTMVAETPPATGKPESTTAPSTTTSSAKVPSPAPPTHVEEIPTGTRYIPGVMAGAPPMSPATSATSAPSGTPKKPEGKTGSFFEMIVPKVAEKKALSPEEVKFKKCRDKDFEKEANLKIGKVKKSADGLITDIKKDLKSAQDSYHDADRMVQFHQNQKKAGLLGDLNILQQAYVTREIWFDAIQHQKRRLDEVAAWRSQKTREIWSLRDGAKNGSFDAYNKLINYDVKIKPGQFKPAYPEEGPGGL